MTDKPASTRHRPTVLMAESPQTKTVRVFPTGPSVDCYFSSEAAERARKAMVRCIERTEGPALLIGPSGSGKSLLLAVVADLFRYRLSVAVLTGGLLRSPRELHQGILYALGMSYRGLDEGELRLALLQRLDEDDDSQEGVLLLIDEAQLLGVELMEEIRMLTNVVRDGVCRVRIVLAGTPDLEEQLADARLASFQQRIALRCYLTAMSRAETKAYVEAHLSAAQLDADLFSADAIDQIYDFTEGLPRLVNQICDHVLLLAQAEERAPIDAPLVDEAWADLQQLPAPQSSGTRDGEPLPPEDVLEFGALGDEDAPSAQIDAIQEQLSSIKFESGRDADAGGDGRAADDEVDFSLPEDEWPEVEVVLRAAPSSHAGDYEEEEVVADPFQTAPAAHAPTWAPSRRAAVTEVAGVPAGIPTDKADQVRERDVPPLQSVPLMAHVETNLYTPDPVWPDEQLSTASIVLPTNGAADAILGTVGGWDRASQELAADIATTPRMPVQAPPSAKRRPTTPAQKKFGALFTSLQD